ncbi:MAG TPA: ATP-binding protein [Blastocatellia bacterium]|nr:ATP-binding protein [Blastocatellia bacterium]
MSDDKKALAEKMFDIWLLGSALTDLRYTIVPIPSIDLLDNDRHQSSGGRIEIRARRNAGALHLQVSDNGPGLKQSDAGKNQAGNGLAVINTRERLRNLYGDFHRFEMANAPEGGLTVTLEIPFETYRETRDCAYDE